MDPTLISEEVKTALRGEMKESREKLEKALEGVTAEQGGLKTALTNMLSRLDGFEAIINAPGSKGKDDPETKTIAQQLWESDQRKAFAARAKHEGGFAVAFKDVFAGMERKTTIDSSAVGNATAGILVGERIPGIQFAGVRKLRIRDLIPSMPTTNNALDYVKENAFTNNAYPQTESSNKGESALTFTIAQAPVRTIAHWIPASTQVLDDWDALRAAIDFKLLVGLKDEEDFELLRGDGTGNHITGLVSGATAFNTGLSTAGDTIIDVISTSFQQLETANREATGVVLNPVDWRKITRIKTDVGGANTGAYLMGGPGQMAVPMLWNVPIALSNAMPAGKFLSGDFMRGAMVGDRMDARIDVSNQHSDFFIKNLVAIRAEERLALAIFRSDYFVYGNLY